MEVKVGDKIISDEYKSTKGKIHTVVEVCGWGLTATCDAEESGFLWTFLDGSYTLLKPQQTYEVGCWYGWTGGECPVPEGTLVDVRLRDGYLHLNEPASAWFWGSEGYPIVSFKVVSYPEEEKKHVFVGWSDGVFYQKDAFFEGATHKFFEDGTVEALTK